MARIGAATTTTAVFQATIREPDLSVGMVLSIQTHGSLADWQPRNHAATPPHIHALVTDGEEELLPYPQPQVSCSTPWTA